MLDCKEDLPRTILSTSRPEQDSVGHSIQIDQSQRLTREALEYHAVLMVLSIGDVSYSCRQSMKCIPSRCPYLMKARTLYLVLCVLLILLQNVLCEEL